MVYVCMYVLYMYTFSSYTYESVYLPYSQANIICFRWNRWDIHQLHYDYLLVLLTWPALFASSSLGSLSTQQDHIIPPEHKSNGFPPLKTHDIDSPHSNFWPR